VPQPTTLPRTLYETGRINSEDAKYINVIPVCRKKKLFLFSVFITGA
jgi:hypothetical protein